MANRYYEKESLTKLYQTYRFSTSDQVVKRMIDYLLEKYTGELNLAVDVGCGSGQNTVLLANYFKKVIGTDVSPNQIANAISGNSNDNIYFEVGPAESINVPDNSVQLITAASAAHWFDLPKFYEEGRRILCPGGVMGLYSCTRARYEWPRNPDKNEEISKAYQAIAFQGEMLDFTPELTKKHILTGYKDITIPYEDHVRDNSMSTQREVTLAELLGQTQTYSCFQNFRDAMGEGAAQEKLNTLKSRIIEIILDDLTPEEVRDAENCIRLCECKSMYLVMARKGQ